MALIKARFSYTFKDKGFAKTLQKMAELGITGIQVGVVGEKANEPVPDGRGLTQGENALIQEFGTNDGHIPPRYVISKGFQRHIGEMKSALRTLVRNVITNGASVYAEAAIAGRKGADIMRDRILNSEIRPRDAQATRDKKGALPALFDSGSLAEAIGYRVKMGDNVSVGDGAHEASSDIDTPDGGE